LTAQERAAAIRKTVRALKRGTFASYGEVARRAGFPGRARLVGQVLRESGSEDRNFAHDEIAWSPQRRWRSSRTGVTYPVEWKITVGERTILLRPLLDDQENDARASTGTLYWEGAVRAFDERGRAIGRGYLELTGYGERLRL